jgi:hypothetical protein
MSGFTVNLRGFSIELDRRTLLEPTDLDFRAGSSSVIVGPHRHGEIGAPPSPLGPPSRAFLPLGGDLEMGGIRAYASGERPARPHVGASDPWPRLRARGKRPVPESRLDPRAQPFALAPGSRPSWKRASSVGSRSTSPRTRASTLTRCPAESSRG